MPLSINLTVNGVRKDVVIEDPRVTLLDLLRERLELTGTKKGSIAANAARAPFWSTDGAIANAIWHATGVTARRFPIRIEDLVGWTGARFFRGQAVPGKRCR